MPTVFSAEIAKDTIRFVELAASLSCNLYCRFQSKMLNIVGIDDSHIMIIQASIPVSTEKPFDVWFTATDLAKIIKGLKTFELTWSNKEKLLRCSSTIGKRVRSRSLHSINSDQEPVNMEILDGLRLNGHNFCTIDMQFIKEALNDAEIYSKNITLSSMPKKLTLSAEGSQGDMQYEIETDELRDANFTAEQNATISCKFLSLTLKCFTIPKLIFESSEMCPPVIFSEKTESDCEFHAYLAQLVEQDDPQGALEE